MIFDRNKPQLGKFVLACIFVLYGAACIFVLAVNVRTF